MRTLALGLIAGSAALAASQPPVTLQQVSIQRVKTIGVVFQKSAPSGGRGTRLRVLSDGRVEVRFASVVDLARLAYGFEETSAELVTSSAGDWTSSDRFDITATTNPPWRVQEESEILPSELRLALQSLLAEHFALVVRTETRSAPVYALRRIEGRPAPGMRRSKNECLGPFTASPPAPAAKPRCPSTQSPESIVAGAVTMSDFARVLNRARRVDRVVVDDTGLTETYDVTVTVAGVRKQTEYFEADLATMLLRQALATQLGLDLEPIRRSMPALVIERAKRPAEPTGAAKPPASR